MDILDEVTGQKKQTNYPELEFKVTQNAQVSNCSNR